MWEGHRLPLLSSIKTIVTFIFHKLIVGQLVVKRWKDKTENLKVHPQKSAVTGTLLGLNTYVYLWPEFWLGQEIRNFLNWVGWYEDT